MCSVDIVDCGQRESCLWALNIWYGLVLHEASVNGKRWCLAGAEHGFEPVYIIGLVGRILQHANSRQIEPCDYNSTPYISVRGSSNDALTYW